MVEYIEYIVGYHAIYELLGQKAIGATLYCARSKLGNKKVAALCAKAKHLGCKVVLDSMEALDKLCATKEHRGVLLALKESSKLFPSATIKDLPIDKSRDTGGARDFALWLEDLSIEEATVLVLDSITDTHNIGAIFRSALQLGADLLVLPKHGSGFSGGIDSNSAKSSCGAVAYMPYSVVTNIAVALKALKDKGFWVYGAKASSSAIWDIDFAKRSCIVLGAEGEGLRRLVEQNCDALVAIPMTGPIDSLNVSVAAGVLLYERLRQSAYRSGKL